jgi:hypothetical protein
MQKIHRQILEEAYYRLLRDADDYICHAIDNAAGFIGIHAREAGTQLTEAVGIILWEESRTSVFDAWIADRNEGRYPKKPQMREMRLIWVRYMLENW